MQRQELKLFNSTRGNGLRRALLTLTSLAFLAGAWGCNKKETPPPAGSEAPAASPVTPSLPTPAESPAPSTPSGADTAAAAPAAPPATTAKPAAPAAPAAPAKPMDFGLPLQAIQPANLTFGSFQGRKVLLFYFGPACPHCHEALPHVQAFADEIRSKGYETLAIATSRSNPAEIQEFIVNYRCRLPVFWDAERKFGGTYEVKVLPTLYLVGPEGIRHRNDGFDAQKTLAEFRAKI